MSAVASYLIGAKTKVSAKGKDFTLFLGLKTCAEQSLFNRQSDTLKIPLQMQAESKYKLTLHS